ncbi:MAG: hypothetical protein PHQ19_03475 [Candidatus Krumholzibacteria bacterium]|nr:hypothetical protein [Candidatus Krumholzibacteria bacterium]
MIRRVLIIAAAVCAAVSGCSAARLELVSRSLLQGPARGAAFFDGGVLLASGGAVLVVPDGFEPEDGFVLQLDGEPMEVAAAGRAAWAAARGAGLVAIDLADLSAPSAVLARRSPKANSCAASGRWLLLADDAGGLLLFDIADPLRPSLSDSTGPGRIGARCAASGAVFAVSAGDSVELYAVADDGALGRASSIVLPSAVRRCLFAGSALLVVGGDGTIRRFDASDPSHPLPLPAVPETDISDAAYDGRRGLALRRDGLLIPFSGAGGQDDPSGNAFRDVLISLRRAIFPAGGAWGKRRFPGLSIEASANKCVFFGPEDGFHLFDLSRDSSEPAGSVETSGFAIEVFVRDGRVYLANGRGGLRIGRIDSAGSVAWTGRLPIADARDMTIAGDILVAACGRGGSRYYRLDPAGEPREIGSVKSPFYLSAVATTGTLACFAGGLGGAEIVDFADPSRPRLVWRERFSEVRGLDTDGERLYLCDGFEGIRIFSLGPAGRPAPLSRLDTPGWCCDACISGRTLYIAEGGNGVAAVDVSDPAAPVMLGSVRVGAIAREVHARGSTLFVASQINGIAAVDFSDPRAPVIAAHHPSVDDARGVFDDGRFVYLASGSGGLYIFRYFD